MAFVSKQDIVREYSDTVAGALATGWTIFTPTMNGSQGEDAHVDLINAEHTIVWRVLLYKDSSWGDGCDHKYVITVHSYVPEDARAESWEQLWDSGYATIWNDKGTEISKRVFYAMPQGDDYRNYHYTTDEAVPAAAKERREYKWKNGLYDHSGRWGDEKQVVKVDRTKLAKFIRTHGGRGYGNCHSQDIKAVYKYSRNDGGRFHYQIQFNGAKKNLVF